MMKYLEEGELAMEDIQMTVFRALVLPLVEWELNDETRLFDENLQSQYNHLTPDKPDCGVV